MQAVEWTGMTGLQLHICKECLKDCRRVLSFSVCFTCLHKYLNFPNSHFEKEWLKQIHLLILGSVSLFLIY